MGSVGPSVRRKVVERDISNLEQLLGNSNAAVVRPSDAKEYDDSITVWSAAVKKQAGVVVQPTTAEEVATVVQYALYHSVDLSVKCGGHSTAGASSSDGGILIDLHAKMRNVEVDVQNGVFRIQGGANWGDVDSAGWRHKLATVGGTVAHTGVGGLVLGGGHGWLSGERGLAIDNVVEFTLVLASGEIVKVSEKERKDLFWALRGAGQNFGVVTEFVMKAAEVGPVWAGQLFYEPRADVIEKVVATINELYAIDKSGHTKLGPRAAGGIGIGRPEITGRQTTLLVPIVFFGEEKEGRKIFDAFFQIGPVNSNMGMVEYPAINNMYDTPYGVLRTSMKGWGFKTPMQPSFIQEVLDIYTNFTEQTNDDRDESLVLWEVYDTYAIATMPDGGSFANRGFHFNGMIAGSWMKEEHDDKGRQWVRDVVDIFKKEVMKGAQAAAAAQGPVKAEVKAAAPPPLVYGNYDQYAEGKMVFGANYARLREVKAEYDPLNVFDKLFPVEPAA